MTRAPFRSTSGFAATLTLLVLTACSAGNSGGGGTKTTPPPPTPSPYVASSVLLLSQSAINTFPLSSNGAALTTSELTPTSTLTAPSGTVFTAMAQDAAGNLYVGAYQSTNIFSQEILVYPAGSSGSATPSRTVSGTATRLSTLNLSLPEDQLYGILALAVDSNGQIYATVGPSILAFSANANGNVAPARVISGSSTGLTYVTTLAVDSSNNILATNVDSTLSIGELLDFNATANGNAAPAHTYAGVEMSFAFGLDLDSNNNVYVSDTTGGGKIYVYSPTADSPTRTFTTDASASGGSYESFWGLRQDKSGYTFVAVQLLNSGMTGIQVFAPTATGDTACVTFTTSVPYVRDPQILLR